MARTITEIKNEIIAEKNKRLDLSEMESDSKVSIYNGWAYVCAAAISSFETIMDIFKASVENTINNRINGTPQFYVNQSYKYQDGDSLIVSEDGTEVSYPAIDESKKIITRASYEESTVSGGSLDKMLLIKVATGSTGNLYPLTAEELVRFTSYLDKIKFAGTNIKAVSKVGDVLIPRLTVFHDGLLPEAIIRTRVRDALISFTTSLSFDSSLYVTKLMDAITAIDNITDAYVDPIAVPAQGVFIRPYNDDAVIQPEVRVDRYTQMEAGYIRESSKTGQEVDVPSFSDAIVIKVDNQ